MSTNAMERWAYVLWGITLLEGGKRAYGQEHIVRLGTPVIIEDFSSSYFTRFELFTHLPQEVQLKIILHTMDKETYFKRIRNVKSFFCSRKEYALWAYDPIKSGEFIMRLCQDKHGITLSPLIKPFVMFVDTYYWDTAGGYEWLRTILEKNTAMKEHLQTHVFADAFGCNLLMKKIIPMFEKVGLSLDKMCDTQGRTPLMYAVIAGSIKAVDYLLEKKVNVNVQDNRGFSAGMYIFLHENPLKDALQKQLFCIESFNRILKNKQGKTIFSLTKEDVKVSIKDLLKEG